MPRPITSTDWHLEGVSVEVRKATALYATLHDLKHGPAADELLRESLQRHGLLGGPSAIGGWSSAATGQRPVRSCGAASG
jgi:hypothetical protein